MVKEIKKIPGIIESIIGSDWEFLERAHLLSSKASSSSLSILIAKSMVVKPRTKH